jgi:subtilase family serine protease
MQKFVYLTLVLAIILSTACITIVQPGATAPGGTAPGPQKPAAFIDQISPSSLNWGESVNFSGHGTASSGSITAYLWRSSIDGNLGSRANFNTTRLSPGNHIVFFSVQDSSGNWSLETQGTVNVISGAAADPGTPPSTDPGTAPPADTGAPPADEDAPPADAGAPPADAGAPPALQADLRITTGNPTVNPSTVASGGTVSLSGWTVKNEGTAASGAFSNGFYLSTNQIISSGDTYLDGNSNVSLPAGAQHNWGSATLTIPAATLPGNYYIGIVVDRTKVVAESNENNNYVSSPITVTAGAIGQADLRITTGNPTVNPSTVAPGGTVSLSGWTVKNEGTVASGAFFNGFYLSTNQIISSSDTYLDGNSNVSLPAGAQHNWGIATLTIPAATLPGNYYIGIVVDRTKVVAESNENNNYVSSPITVAAAIGHADLRITTGNPTVNPSIVAHGGTVSLSGWTVKNEGTVASGAFFNGFYLSTNQIISSSDTYLDGNSNVSLPAGAQHNWGSATLTIPAATLPGNYYIGIVVDRTKAVVEINENNNYVSSPIKVLP